MQRVFVLFAFVLSACGGQDDWRGYETSAVYPGDAALAARRQVVATYVRGQVSSAVSHMTDGQTIEVAELFEGHCWPIRASYSLSRESGELHLGLRIGVVPGPGVSNGKFATFVDQVRSCVSPMQEMFLRYGIRLDLEYKTPEEGQENAHRTIELMGGLGRSNSAQYYLESDSEVLCGTLAHEAGHLLGLPDEYYEWQAFCKNTDEFKSREEFPFSIMSESYRGLEQVEFLPRHFVTILGPVYDPGGQVPRHQLRIRREMTLHARRAVTARVIEFPSGRWARPEEWMPLKPGTCQLEILFGPEDLKLRPGQGALFLSDRPIWRPRRTGRYSDRIQWIQGGGDFTVQRFECDLPGADWRKAASVIGHGFEFLPVE